MADRLHEAARHGNLLKVKMFLRTIDVNRLSTQGYTAICEACKTGKLEVVQYLLERGADIEVGKRSCLYEACWNGNVRVVRFLLENGANVENKNEK